MDKLRINEVLVVEGRYDATALASLVDGLILTTDGFSIFSDNDKKELLRTLGKKKGLVILTDSDAAGFRIRTYVGSLGLSAGCVVKHAYIPAVPGKEKRKKEPSGEGTLGVEGMPPEVLRQALELAGVVPGETKRGSEITYTDLFELGISGRQDSAIRRRELLRRLGLPPRLSKWALKEVLSSLYTREELRDLLLEKPVLFWDFHGTLTLPDQNWFDCAMEAAAEQAPETPLEREVLVKYFGGTCLPWFSVPSRDTRHLTGPEAWWGHCEAEFVQMLQNCGFSEEQARRIAPQIRPKVLDPRRYTLYPDTRPTLQALKRRGYLSFVLSNNFPELDQLIKPLGLAPYISGVVVSGLVGYDKPRPEIFAAALEQAYFPEQAWMIGDNPVDDIEGGKAAGLKTIAVHGVTSPKADHCVDNLSEILAFLN